MASSNFLLGKGERLIYDVLQKTGGGEKQAPYTFAQARTRLTPMLEETVNRLDALPSIACPNGRVVATLTLNPEYIAKSYFPDKLLQDAGLVAVGSRPKRVKPERRSKGREPSEALTTELFVMGSRDAFHHWQRSMHDWREDSRPAGDLVTLEQISAPLPSEKVKGHIPKSDSTVFEVVLHGQGIGNGKVDVIPVFREYLHSLDAEAEIQTRFSAGGLCFVEIEGPSSLAEPIAAFSIVRAVREMPRLRVLRPAFRTSSIPSSSIKLPAASVIDKSIRTAIFDGGVPENHVLSTWVTPIDTDGVTAPHEEFLSHGVGVTSAYLFGHVDPRAPLPTPYSRVDHYRVLDDAPGQNPHELYEVLERIRKVLATEKQYDFINFSVGPALPIIDDDVHAWTAVLDEYLGKNDTLASIAVGNNGEGIGGLEDLQLTRVQVPSDCVNAIAIGAADTPDKTWGRAVYSSVGPGRSPGLIKPDLVEFGGSLPRPFLVLGADDAAQLEATGGTSFASPAVLRLGAGIKAHFGGNLGLLAVRALLTHTAEPSQLPHSEVGWGRVARNLEDIVLCDDDMFRVIYQGDISPTKSIRAPIPMPDSGINGLVEITATLCYKCSTDANHPGNYTRAGLQVSFRPHDGKFSRGDQLHPNTKPFFSAVETSPDEEDQRRDAWKWENCLHAKHRFKATSLSNPCFDIHYNARFEGRDFRPNEKLPYALE